jgi:hypothetical protein
VTNLDELDVLLCMVEWISRWVTGVGETATREAFFGFFGKPLVSGGITDWD